MVESLAVLGCVPPVTGLKWTPEVVHWLHQLLGPPALWHGGQEMPHGAQTIHTEMMIATTAYKQHMWQDHLPDMLSCTSRQNKEKKANHSEFIKCYFAILCINV